MLFAGMCFNWNSITVNWDCPISAKYCRSMMKDMALRNITIVILLKQHLEGQALLVTERP